MACCVKGCNSRGGKKGSEKRSLFTPRTVSIYVSFIFRNHCCIYVKE